MRKNKEETSKRLNEAYEVLSDPDKGKEYDNELRQGATSFWGTDVVKVIEKGGGRQKAVRW